MNPAPPTTNERTPDLTFARWLARLAPYDHRRRVKQQREREGHEPGNHQEKPGDAEVIFGSVRREDELMAHVVQEQPAGEDQAQQEQAGREEDGARVREAGEP